MHDGGHKALTNRKVALAWCAMGKGVHMAASGDVDGAPVVVAVVPMRGSGAVALARARMGGPNTKECAAWMRTCLGQSVCFFGDALFPCRFLFFFYFLTVIFDRYFCRRDFPVLASTFFQNPRPENKPTEKVRSTKMANSLANLANSATTASGSESDDEDNADDNDADDNDDDTNKTSKTNETSKPRSSGIPFERYANKVLRNMANGKPPKDLNSDSSLEEVLANKSVYLPFCNVPAKVLVEVGWEPRDEHERRKIYNGPAEGRAFFEYGLDGIGISNINDKRHLISIQHKDHKLLSVGVLGRFMAKYIQAHEFNIKQGFSRGTPSSLLCYPAESHITSRDLSVLNEHHKYFGLMRLAIEEFCPTALYDPEEPEVKDLLKEKKVAPNAHCTKPVPVLDDDQPEPNQSGEEEEDGSAAVYKHTIPIGAKERRFQTETVNIIVENKGINLVKGPPGAGKTAISMTCVGNLVLPDRGLRSGPPYYAFIVAPFIDHCAQAKKSMERIMRHSFGATWKNIVQTVYDEKLPTKKEMETNLQRGKRVFLSTDTSAHLLFEVAKFAKSKGYRILVIKDEAHYNSYKDSSSTKLLSLVDREKGDVGIACTATPDDNVMELPNLKTALDMSLEEAIRLGYCAPYEIVLPLITTKDDDLPIEAQKI
ncbi:DEAD/DEAH box helicase family protein, partial [bacterium]|nr:DEAD/DEAH box helicase family protein [bacterium]